MICQCNGTRHVRVSAHTRERFGRTEDVCAYCRNFPS